MDYKEWIQQRADELAEEILGEGKDFYNLSDDFQIEVWDIAEQDYNDRESDRIDAAYDRYLKQQMKAATVEVCFTGDYWLQVSRVR